MAVPTTVADLAEANPSVPMYCRTTGPMTEADPASARPNPSSSVFLPSVSTSSGMSSYFVLTMNSATYRVSPGALASSSAPAASADLLIVSPASARGVLKESRRIMRHLCEIAPSLPHRLCIIPETLQSVMMTAERWQRIEELYHAALARDEPS